MKSLLLTGRSLGGTSLQALLSRGGQGHRGAVGTRGMSFATQSNGVPCGVQRLVTDASSARMKSPKCLLTPSPLGISPGSLRFSALAKASVNPICQASSSLLTSSRGKKQKAAAKAASEVGKLFWPADSGDWLIDWLIVRLLARPSTRLIVWLVDQSMDWLSDLLIEAVRRMRTRRNRMTLSWKMTPMERWKTGRISKPTFTIPGVNARHGGFNRINQKSAREQRIGRWFFLFQKLDFTPCTWRFDDFSSWSFFHMIAEPTPLSRLAWRHPEGMPFVFG